MALFLAGQGKVGRPGLGAGLLGVLVAGLPLLGAALIAVSRTEDYRHGEFGSSSFSRFLVSLQRTSSSLTKDSCRRLRRKRRRQSRNNDCVVELSTVFPVLEESELRSAVSGSG